MKTNERKKVIHIKSNVLENGLPKLPSSGSIEYGEIAINYAASGETISIKNTNNEIVTFSSDKKINEKINSAITIIENNELITSSALNDLNDRIKAVSGRTVDLTGYATEDWVNSQGYLTEHQSLTGLVSNAEYISSSRTIEFYNLSGTVLATIDATDFIKDGMVNSVVISGATIGEKTDLVVTFNTDAGKEDIYIPLTDIFDPNEYYTKDEINVLSGIVTDLSSNTIDIENNLNSLSGIVTDLSSNTFNNLSDLNNSISNLSGSTVTIENDITLLSSSTVDIESRLNYLTAQLGNIDLILSLIISGTTTE